MEGVRPVDNRGADWDAASGDRFTPRRGASEEADHNEETGQTEESDQSEESDGGEEADRSEDKSGSGANDTCPPEYEAEDYMGPPPPPPSGDNVYQGENDPDHQIPPSPGGQTVDPNIESGNDINAAIGDYRKAADEAAVKSINTAIGITKINGTDNAVKKINPS